MLASNENRFQYVYFVLSGIVATTLLVLTYVCLKTTADYNLTNELREHQQTINFTKPDFRWDYNNTWRSVGDSALGHMIFSAYFDRRVEVLDNTETIDIAVGSFRIFAILPLLFRDVISCIIRYDNYQSKEIKAEYVEPIFDHNNHIFAGYSIMCPLHVNRLEKEIKLPKSIAISYVTNRLSRITPTYIPISYPRDMNNLFAKSKPVISVCVGPLSGPYNDVLRIVEFIEIYRILGASHFYFYNFNSTNDVLRLLDFYRKQGIVDIFNWNIGSKNTENIEAKGSMALINDCVYRASIVDNYRYAAVIDLDELIMPFKHNSLADYLRQCDEGRSAAYVFRNVFFFKKDHLDTFSVPAHIRNRQLYSQTRIRRSLEILPAHERSKCVVNAHAIVVMRMHLVGVALPGYAETIVHPHVGLLYHYRDKCLNCRQLLITDFGARRFGSLIWNQVDEVCLKVFMDKRGVCPLE